MPPWTNSAHTQVLKYSQQSKYDPEGQGSKGSGRDSCCLRMFWWQEGNRNWWWSRGKIKEVTYPLYSDF